jgi:hypothetical protein
MGLVHRMPRPVLLEGACCCGGLSACCGGLCGSKESQTRLAGLWLPANFGDQDLESLSKYLERVPQCGLRLRGDVPLDCLYLPGPFCLRHTKCNSAELVVTSLLPHCHLAYIVIVLWLQGPGKNADTMRSACCKDLCVVRTISWGACLSLRVWRSLHAVHLSPGLHSTKYVVRSMCSAWAQIDVQQY